MNAGAVHRASEEDESVNHTEVVENQVQKVNVTFDVTPEIAAESETKMFDILIQLLKIHQPEFRRIITGNIIDRDKQSVNYQDIGYKKRGMNKTLFIKFFKTGIMIVQVDDDSIVFGSIGLSIAVDEFIHDRSYYT